jgi:arginyl-tRNA synthetase
LRKANAELSQADDNTKQNIQHSALLPLEKNLIVLAEQFPSVIEEAATLYDPSKIALYIYELAKSFSSFYTELSIASAETDEKKQLRLKIAWQTAIIIKTGMHLMGIKAPERM